MNALLPLHELNECDREPIHTPGAIQSHGALLAFDTKNLHVTHASSNLAELLGITPTDALKQTIAALLGEQIASQLPDAAQARRINPGVTGFDAEIAGRRCRLLPFISGPKIIGVDIVSEQHANTTGSSLI